MYFFNKGMITIPILHVYREIYSSFSYLLHKNSDRIIISFTSQMRNKPKDIGPRPDI